MYAAALFPVFPLLLALFSDPPSSFIFSFLFIARGITEPYLGLLYPTDNFTIYGYLSNTDVKLIAVLDEGETKDGEIKQFFDTFHSLYLHTISNPFYVMGTAIRSTHFETELAKLIVTVATN